MTRAWPKGFDARQFSPEEREVLVMGERMNLMEAAIKKLQEAQKK